MSRPVRIEIPGGLYHVMSRGNDRRGIVRDDADREKRLEWLRRTVETYGWLLHAFVVMTNHDHLFVQTPLPNLSAGMQYYNGSYSSYFNRRHRRCGHLFQGRFKAHIVETEGHYLELSRYIHLNPVRSPLATKPEDWPWSSYRGYHRASQTLEWVTYAAVLREFGRDQVKARTAYRKFVRAGMDNPPMAPWSDAVHGLIVGSEAFVDKMRRVLYDEPSDPAIPQLAKLRSQPSLERIISTTADVFKADEAQWSPGRRANDASRAVAAYIARRLCRHRAKDIAAALGYTSASGVGQAIRRVEGSRNHLAKVLQKIERRVSSG